MKAFAGENSYAMFGTELPQIKMTKGRQLALLVVVAIIASSTLAMAQAGSLDATFGTGGIFTTSHTQYNTTINSAAAIQSDGKIVLGGTVPSGNESVAALIRLNTNGTIDSSFGSGGVVTSDFGLTDGAAVTAIAIQPNGQILAGAVGALLIESSVGRFNADGTIDTSFGTGGFAISNSVDSGEGTISQMALQADGKILITGGGLIGRYTSTGQPDTSFGESGIAPLTSTQTTAIALQADGKIVVTTGIGAPPTLTTEQFLPVQQAGTIARYNTDGSLDTNFGISGQAACVDSAAAVAIQGNGKIVVAGLIPSALLTANSGGRVVMSNQTGFGVVRYNANGSVDTTFNPGGGLGSGGGAITGFGNLFPASAAFAVAIQSNGEILVAGQAGIGNGNGDYASSSFVLARYTTSGHLDTAFGSNGTVLTTLGQPSSLVNTLLLQSDGKIVAAGNTGIARSRGEYMNNFAVARYLAQ
jgi:uncharacterized delta-60 repeat protein